MKEHKDHYNKICFFQGEFRPLKEANVNIQTHALQYGTACIGGMRAYWNKIKNNLFLFRIEDHIHRLLNSAKILMMNMPYSEKELIEISKQVLSKGEWKQNVYLRPIIYKSSDELTPIMHSTEDSFALYAIPLNDYMDVNKGLTTSISSWRRMGDYQIPAVAKTSAGYLNSSLAKSEATLHGYDEAIFLDNSGHVSEGSAENLFIVREGTLITPDISSSILEGIVRKTIIKLARDMDFPVIERKVSRTELYTCDEAFFVGSGVQVAWIKSVDTREIGDGKQGALTKRIQELFFRVVRGEEKIYSSWLAPIY